MPSSHTQPHLAVVVRHLDDLGRHPVRSADERVALAHRRGQLWGRQVGTGSGMGCAARRCRLGCAATQARPHVSSSQDDQQQGAASFCISHAPLLPFSAQLWPGPAPLPTCAATPKSASLTSPASVSRMLPHLMSRCTCRVVNAWWKATFGLGAGGSAPQARCPRQAGRPQTHPTSTAVLQSALPHLAQGMQVGQARQRLGADVGDHVLVQTAAQVGPKVGGAEWSVMRKKGCRAAVQRACLPNLGRRE